jgi:cell division protein FtsB
LYYILGGKVLKKSSLIVVLVITFLLGSVFSVNPAQAADTVASLKKQVTQLQAQVKSLTSKLKVKDQEIAKLKKENAALKLNAATASKTKVSYKGLVKTGVITYKDNEYIPVSYVKDVLGIPVSYDRKGDINYIGGKPDGIYMSDIMKPYYGSAVVNETMIVGQQSYYKGYSFYSKMSSGKGELAFNLNKKYKTLSGKMGTEDSKDYSEHTVKVFGDGELLGVFEIKAGDLPIDINLDVTNVAKLQFEATSRHYLTDIFFLDFIIK